MSGQASFIIILLIVSVAVRLWNLTASTEFLGDQGRTFLHVFSAWENKTIPLVGPTVLSGQYLGPAYYFLIAPFLIASGFQLISGAYAILFYGSLGVLFTALAFSLLFPMPIAFVVTALWGLSPFTVGIDRFLWEPNLVPPFVMLFIWGSVLLVRTKKKLVASVLLGVSTGILVQLHYPNMLFIPLSLLVFVMAFSTDKISRKMWMKLLVVYIGFFLFVLSPFVYHELTHGFENTISVVSQFIHPTVDPIGKRQIVMNFVDYAGRVMGKVSPVSLGLPIGAGILCIMTIVWFAVYHTPFSFLMLCWVLGGVGILSLYRGVVFDHYLYFLVPAVYVVLAHWLHVLSGIQRLKPFLYISLSIFLISNFYQSASLVYKVPKRQDIARVTNVINIINKELGSEVFSFGLVTSPSFSDLHFRAGFTFRGMNAQKISGIDYKIVLVCEREGCPFADHGGKIQTLCNEDHCTGDYPIVNLDLYSVRVVKNGDTMVLFGQKLVQ